MVSLILFTIFFVVHPDPILSFFASGPQGFRCSRYPGTSTSFPGGLTIGSTFDEKLAYDWGEAMGEEFLDKGANVQLGPGVNVARVPNNGRNFEYISGGDPYLGYKLVQPIVKGIQSVGVIANAKHFVNNNQETDRTKYSAEVDDRTRHEFYYVPFEGAVRAGVGSFMCSYNKVNDVYACENPTTLKKDLKDGLKFEGWVMSDWGATHSTVDSMNAGLDQEMPSGLYYSSIAMKAALQNGKVTESQIDESVLRMLTPMFQMGIFDRAEPDRGADANDVTSKKHAEVARNIAAAAQILLKNENNALPLMPVSNGEPIKIALIGNAAFAPVTGGGGSGSVYADPKQISSPYEAFLEMYGISGYFDDGVKEEVTCTTDTNGFLYRQNGCSSVPAKSVDDCKSKCADDRHCNFWSFNEKRCSMYPTNGFATDGAKFTTSGTCTRKYPTTKWQCNEKNQCITIIDKISNDEEDKKQILSEADVSIVLLGTTAVEGQDRIDLSFDLNKNSNLCQVAQENANDLVSTVASIMKKSKSATTIVAGVSPGAVLLPWKDEVDAILLSMMPGQEYGHALTDVMFNKVNPTARLPMTIPNKDNEVAFSDEQYPGVNYVTNYTEAMYIDYRWYLANKVKPSYSFGHGKSYTSFDYGKDLKVECGKDFCEFTFELTNVGKVAGAEVAQLYINYPAESNTPPTQLKGFYKTPVLVPKESTIINMKVELHELETWQGSWKLWTGQYWAKVGASVDDLRLVQTFNI